MPDEDRPKVNAPRNDDDPLARALAGLKPAAGVDVPTLMYRAGQGSRDRAVAWWRRACLVTGVGLIATWGGVYLAYDRHAPRGEVVERPPLKDMPATDPNLEMLGRAVVGGPRYDPTLVPPALPALTPAPPPAEPPPNPAAEYLRIRDAVLEKGLAGLPASPPPPAPVSVAEFERSFQLPAGVFTAPYRTPRPASKSVEPDEPDPGL